MSLKYPHLQLLIQNSQFHMGNWHKLLKSKHCYIFNITLSWMKICRWRCSRCLCNQCFILCKKFKCLKFRYTEVISEKPFLSFLEMHKCVWYLWTCPSVLDIKRKKKQHFSFEKGKINKIGQVKKIIKMADKFGIYTKL